ncbi:hypothetical protein KC722_02275 [Candidatus Kaiserbacteria bacterium]|nr:hypothetical protein [Candidatus Kaiserbacteria bacterium]MCB9811631.1 hypothetical protein [Candidatus Nomurabacteria bacterium]
MNILVFGDSITQGFYDVECGGWVSRLSTYAQDKTVQNNWEGVNGYIFNLGISGERTTGLRSRFLAEVQARYKNNEDTTVVVAIGINDSIRNELTKENWCPFLDFSQNYDWLITEAKKYGQVITLGLTPIDENILQPIPWFSEYSHYETDRSKYDTEIKRLSTNHGVVHISMNDIFSDKSGPFLVDGLHPNSNGHQLIFQRIKSVLEEMNIL